MITLGIIERVFNIRCGPQSGTCFAIEQNGRQYVVTAKHVLAKMDAQKCIGLFKSGRWNEYTVKVVGISSDNDVAVLAFPEQLCPPNGTEASSIGMAVGQDVYFLGFPYGQQLEQDRKISDFPMPLVKKGILSGIAGNGSGVSHFILDAHNNPGFSGGPVVFERPGAIPPVTSGAIIQRKLKVAGIISGYRESQEPVFQNGQKTSLTYAYNTGIVIAESIHHATEMIEANQIGASIDPESERHPGSWLEKQGYKPKKCSGTVA